MTKYLISAIAIGSFSAFLILNVLKISNEKLNSLTKQTIFIGEKSYVLGCMEGLNNAKNFSKKAIASYCKENAEIHASNLKRIMEVLDE